VKKKKEILIEPTSILLTLLLSNSPRREGRRRLKEKNRKGKRGRKKRKGKKDRVSLFNLQISTPETLFMRGGKTNKKKMVPDGRRKEKKFTATLFPSLLL